MKRPLVECDLLVEVASEKLTAKRGDFLVVYYIDAEHRRAVAVRTFEERANGATPLTRLALPAPKETRGRKRKPKPKPKEAEIEASEKAGGYRDRMVAGARSSASTGVVGGSRSAGGLRPRGRVHL